MKHFTGLFFLFFFSLIFFKSHAQQKHFIYIESEGKQPFAVVLNGKVYSSSDYSYVIVPKLTDGDYNFTVSFPMNKYPDQSFKCVINKKDIGYKLENKADKGWALQNMQTQKILTTGNTIATNNAFGDMLSDVVSDSNLTASNSVNVKPAVDSTLNTSMAKVSADTITNIGFITDSVTQLQKISEAKLDTGTNMVFVDKTSGADTINIFVPSADSVNDHLISQQTNLSNEAVNNVERADSLAVSDISIKDKPQENNTANNTVSPLKDTSKNVTGNPFYKSAEQNIPVNIADPINANTTVINENSGKLKTTSAVKEDCSNIISDNDMDKLKRKMFVQHSDNDMVQTALKYMNNKCLTTDQVRTLGNIFSSDDGRYGLYDALYKNVYDYGNYVTLESQIIDPYYKRRFETLLR